MTEQFPIRFFGAPGSPYTRKMLALLRYRRIAYELNYGSPSDVPGDLPKPKVALLPTFYLPGEDGTLEAVIDSTPIIRRLEQDYAGRSVIPDDPVAAFIDYLIEDYADEWLTKCMFHYRWNYTPDADLLGAIIPLWRGPDLPVNEAEAAARMFAERQIGRLYVVGSNATTGPVIEASYHRILDILKAHFENHRFLMGERPGASDFGVFGQMTQLVQVDPTPVGIMRERAPRVRAWVDVGDDLSGLDIGAARWIDRGAIRDKLGDLLTEIGRVHIPILQATVQALTAGSDTVETEIDGQPWSQVPMVYQAKCLQWIAAEFGTLSGPDQSAVRDILAGTGCEPVTALSRA